MSLISIAEDNSLNYALGRLSKGSLISIADADAHHGENSLSCAVGRLLKQSS